jgi:carbon-monoxide dehydrogenase large subunit
VSTEADGKLVGERVPRGDDLRFLRGEGQFVDDVALPGMLHAAFVRSPFAHARINSIDASAAKRAEGVRAVITGDDLAVALGRPVTIQATIQGAEDVATTVQPVLCTDRVRFLGEAVALVVADSRYLAEDAAELVVVDWDPLEAAIDTDAALGDDAPQLHDDVPHNRLTQMEFSNGDVKGAFRKAARTYARRFKVGRLSAAPLEPRGSIAAYDPLSDHYTLFTSGQGVYGQQALIGLVTGIYANQLRVVVSDVGGSFGQKASIYVEESTLLLASKMVGAPIKWTQDRVENLSSSAQSKEMAIEVEIAVDGDGKFLAFRGRFVGDGGAYALMVPTELINSLQAAIMLPNVYEIGAVKWRLDSVLTNKSPAGPYRGVGWSCVQLPRELLIDEIARDLDLDPAELRLRNLLPSEPAKKIETATKLTYDGGDFAGSIREALEAIGYEELRSEQASARAEGRRLGIAVSPYVESSWSSATAQAGGLPSATYDTASVSVEADGSIMVRTGAVSHGQGHATSFVQIAAEALGVPMHAVTLVQGDTNSGSFGLGSFGSRSAVIASGTIGRAAADVKEMLLKCGGHLLRQPVGGLELAEGTVRVADKPEVAIGLTDIAAAFHFGGKDARPDDVEPPLASTRFYDPPENYSSGAVAAAVEVDAETGMVKVLRAAAVQDAGKAINPSIVEGQLIGGIGQAVGMALLEELIYDDDGQLVTGTLMDYLYPSAGEVPPVEVRVLEHPSPVVDGGVRPVGMGTMVGGPSAIVQAVADALAPDAAPITRTPLTPERVLGLLDGPAE